MRLGKFDHKNKQQQHILLLVDILLINNNKILLFSTVEILNLMTLIIQRTELLLRIRECRRFNDAKHAPLY